MKPTKDNIRRRLGLREAPKPPDDLVRRLKADIPPSFRYQRHVTTDRKGDSTSAFRGLSWQVAVSFLALTIIGVGAYMVTFETQNRQPAMIAEADKAPEMEFSPPTAPSASTPTSGVAAAKPKLQAAASEPEVAYDIAAAPPPPPPSPRQGRADAGIAQGVEGFAAGGVAGGVLGGVAGGASETAANAAAPADKDDDAREQPAESQLAEGRDNRYSEEKGVATIAKVPSAPAAVAPARAVAKDEKATGIRREPSPTLAVEESPSIESLRARAAAGEPLRIGGDVKPPVVIARVDAAYTKEARDAGIEGVVVVELVIGRDGNVKSVRVLKTLPMGLTDAAVTAVKQWKFKPATLEGKPVDVLFTTIVNARPAR